MLRWGVTREHSLNDFGLLIAYVLPGFTALWAGSHLTGLAPHWLDPTNPDPPGVGGFLMLTVASVTAGLTVSTVRWLLIDALNHRTGIPAPQWDFARLEGNAGAFALLVEHNYRYYQFGSHMALALLLAFLTRLYASGAQPVGVTDTALVGLAAILFVGSRDSLRRYYTRGSQLLGVIESPEEPPRPPKGNPDGQRERGREGCSARHRAFRKRAASRGRRVLPRLLSRDR